ncbi:MAG: hypothetical protein OXQ89_00260 [Rhodospirillaceae bacterium]|nr:hypothetical protein [Rhodospirillaceae bacterium]
MPDESPFDNATQTMYVLTACFRNAMRALDRETQIHLFGALMQSADDILDLPSAALSPLDKQRARTLLATLEDPRPLPPELTVVPKSE